MKRVMATMVLCGVLAAGAWAQDESADVVSPVLRHTHYFVLVDPGEATTVTLDTRPFYTYAEGATVEITDPDGAIEFEGMAPLGQSLEATIEDANADAYMVRAAPGMNGVVFSADSPWCVFAGGQWGLGSNGDVPPMYLWAPPDCEQFTVAAKAESPGESGRIMVDDPTGAEVAVMDSTFDEREETLVKVPEAHRGAVWMLRWSDPQEAEGSLDDINTYVEGGLTPVLWPTAGWATEYGQALWERHRASVAEE
jgi:hypothetical protein